SKLIKQTLNSLNAGRALDRFLRFAFLSAKTAGSQLTRRIACMEKARGLAAKMNFPHLRIVTVHALGLSRERDGLFDEWAKFLRLRNGCDDVFLVGIDQRGRHVPKHRHPMLGRPSQF